MHLPLASLQRSLGVCLLATMMVTATRGADTDVEPIAAPAAPAAQPPKQPPAAPLATPAQELGYALGYRIGGRIVADHKSLDMAIDEQALARGLADAVLNAAPQLDEPRLRKVLGEFETAMQKKQQEFMARMVAAAKTNLDNGREFLVANGRRKGVTTLPSGLQYEVLAQGTGPQPGADDIVFAHYKGTHIDGREFDGTDPTGEPASFPLRGVVPGWQEALPLMKAGARWRIYLPPDLGYGEEGSPPTVEPNEVLIFEIELIRSEKARR
jgi:FKBP-type peptidyl-prolyl cis-trans isomerase FklB